jgi:hypothetical protein
LSLFTAEHTVHRRQDGKMEDGDGSARGESIDLVHDDFDMWDLSKGWIEFEGSRQYRGVSFERHG